MLEFEEYKVKLNNLKPELEELYTSLGLEQAKREVEELEIKSSQPGFWDNPEESQKIVSRMGSLKGKVEAYNKMTELCDDLLTICEMAIEENDESMLEELESGYKELEDGIAEQKLRTLLLYTGRVRQPQRARILPRRCRRHRGTRLVRDAVPHVHPLGRASRLYL